MKQIAVCVKETNDGYSSDFLYKSSYFVSFALGCVDAVDVVI